MSCVRVKLYSCKNTITNKINLLSVISQNFFIFPSISESRPNSKMTTATGSAMPTAPPRLKPHELAELTTFGDILHLVHHRNLNQHRHSIWWRSFSVFRRELSHLLSEYATYQPPLAATTASVSKTSSKASKAAARRGAARLEAWKKERVPRWYLYVFFFLFPILISFPSLMVYADVPTAPSPKSSARPNSRPLGWCCWPSWRALRI